MKIKTGKLIKVEFIAEASEDVDSTFFMELIMDSFPQFRIYNPSWHEVSPTTKAGGREGK